MILGNDTLGIKVCIGDISFQTIPLAVLGNLLLADGDLYILADFKELVVSSFIDLLLRDVPTLVGFSQSCNATVAIVSLLLCPFLRIADNQTLSVLPFMLITGFVFLFQ